MFLLFYERPEHNEASGMFLFAPFVALSLQFHVCPLASADTRSGEVMLSEVKWPEVHDHDFVLGSCNFHPP